MMFTTPILFLIFNRPENTKLVFERIRQQKPAKLFIAADGPRGNICTEAAVCNECRDIVLNRIDWPCEVKTLFREENIGCGKAVSSAITWFFQQVDEGVILEDDVLPGKSFFLFCNEMLLKFKDNPAIMHVSGNNFQLSQIGSDCYYLSKLPHSWGWATWRRAWEKFDFELRNFIEEEVISYFDYPTIDKYWHNIFTMTKHELYHHVWDYQWVFANLSNNGLTVIPQQNLVSNIGFGKQSTHTTNSEDFLAHLKSYEMDVEIGKSVVAYNPTADINFQRLFRWEIIKDDPVNISGKDAIKVLVSKAKQKILISK